MNRSQTIHLNLKTDGETITRFLHLLGNGFHMDVRLGCSIRDVLCRQLGIDPDYLEDRIQTVFLDGKAVDDLDTASLKPESVLALSGAMPGLAGATLRRGGHFSKMRGEISHVDEGVCHAGGEGRVTLKLFNLALKDLGPMFLDRGCWIDGPTLHQFLNRLPRRFWEGCLQAELNGRPADESTLKNGSRPETDVFLSVAAAAAD